MVFAVLFILSSCAVVSPVPRKESLAYGRYLKGLLSDRSGQNSEASDFFRQVRSLDKEAVAPYWQLGFNYIRQKNYPKAVAEFEEVLRLAPDDTQARYVLALLYTQLDYYKKAAGQYVYLLDNDAGDKVKELQLRRILSQLYFLNKDFSLAQAQCAEILKVRPVDVWSLYMKATIDIEELRKPQGIKGLEEVLKYEPENSEAMNSLAYIYAEDGVELEKALILSEKAIDIEPGIGAYLDTAGWVYYKLGDFKTSIEYLKKAAAFEIDPVIFYHLGEAYFKNGMVREAKDAWSASLRLDPLQKELRRKIKDL